MNEFRHALKAARQSRGMSQDAVGAELHVSGSQIGNYESGKSVPPEDVAADLDRIFGTGTALADAAREAREEAVAPWLRPWKDSERRAVSLRWFEHSIIPGLLQTEEYARAIIEIGLHTDVQVEQMTRERMARQAATLDRAEPVILSAIIGEAALRHGPPEILKAQLERLVDIGHRPNVHVRTIPLSAGLHPGLTGAFALATLPDGRTVVYLDELTEGRVGTRGRDLRRAVAAWESANALALPWDQSRDLILRVSDELERG